jgi:hypothetical protein
MALYSRSQFWKFCHARSVVACGRRGWSNCPQKPSISSTSTSAMLRYCCSRRSRTVEQHSGNGNEDHWHTQASVRIASVNSLGSETRERQYGVGSRGVVSVSVVIQRDAAEAERSFPAIWPQGYHDALQKYAPQEQSCINFCASRARHQGLISRDRVLHGASVSSRT